ncbi:WAT1-related protein At4g08300-like isoform X1 [Cucurbita pepo subsp. pepo]|uniref:WAT1-related protein n=1 Tax=Cucurbita moschata TaxID=3662 RepID=A0A6J1EWU5_CUCMO|nr:WAT1-related protein At4g08300-like isoform X1 [Cucurbita moschata]XP_023514002.1 WAT1-related protein At4g08300-like isoform X1 [Cucurbita pepo subsp. pepo]
MAMNVRLGVFFTRFKPHILVIFAQVGYTFMYFFTDASFKHGMNPHVHITYRQIVASVGMFPLAYFFERKTRPRMTVTLFLEIFVLSLLGMSLSLNMHFASLTYSSPTFVTSSINTIACLTFIIAVMFRMEIVDLKNPRGIAKVVGTLVSLGGVMIMTFYKGPIIRNLWHPFIHIQHKASNLHENWLKGSLLTVSSCISWALSYIMQAFTLKRYPAQLSLSTWMNLVGAAQSGVFAVLTQHKPGVWSVGLNIDLWCIIYSGIVCSALTVYIQLWCTEEKGPVFVTMFDPLCTVLVAALAYFVFGQKLYMGSIVGGGIVIMGLYMLLWGKEHDKFELQNKSQLESDSVHETFNQPDLQISASPPPNHVLQHQP